MNAGQIFSVQLSGIVYTYTSIDGDTDASVAAQIKELVKGTSPAGEMLTHQNVRRLTVRAFDGNDTLVSRDTAVQTIVEMGDGNDNVSIGVVPQIPDRGNADFENPAGIPIVDLHHLTNGVTAPAYFYGGQGDDYFQVDHNAAEVFLFGEEGDATSVINRSADESVAKSGLSSVAPAASARSRNSFKARWRRVSALICAPRSARCASTSAKVAWASGL